MKTREQQINEFQSQINEKMSIVNSLPLSIHHYPELVAEIDALAEQRNALQAEIEAERKVAANEYMAQRGFGEVFEA